MSPHWSTSSALAPRQELDIVRDRIQNSLTSGSTCFLVLSGPAGIGKTTLISQLRKELALRSITPLTIHIDLKPDYGLVDLFSSFVQQLFFLRPEGRHLDGLSPYQSQLARWLRQGAADPAAAEGLDPASESDLWLLSTSLSASASRDEDHGLLFVIDDFHEADDGIAEWLKSFVRWLSVEGTSIALIVTCRDQAHTALRLKTLEELAGETNEALLSLPGIKYQAWQVRLAPLDGDGIGQMLNRLFQEDFSENNPEYVSWLTLQSGGSPYFLRLLLDISGEAGIVEQLPDIGWKANDGFHRLRLPPSLQEMIWQNLQGSLSDPLGASAIESLAVLGSPALFEDWAAFIGIPRSDLIQKMMELESRSILQDRMLRHDHQVMFVHPLIGEIVLDRMPQERKQHWRKRAADFFMQRKDPLNAWEQFLKGDLLTEMPEGLLGQALETARLQRDWHRILRWHRAGEICRRDQQILLDLAALQAAEELGLLQKAVSLAERMKDGLHLLTPKQRMLYYQKAHASLMRLSPVSCQPLLNEAFAWCSSLPAEASVEVKAELDLLQLFLYQNQNDFENCSRLAEHLCQEHADDAVTLMRVRNTLGLMILSRGAYQEAEMLYRTQVIPKAEEVSPIHLGIALGNWAKALMRLARYPEAEQAYQKALEIHRQQHMHEAMIILRANLGGLHWNNGRHLQALAEMEAVYRAAYIKGDLAIQSEALNNIVGIRGEMGQGEGLPALLERNLHIKRILGNEIGAACTMLNLSECYSQGIGAQQDFEAAHYWSALALETLKKKGTKKYLPEALMNLSQACSGLGRFHEAVAHAEEAYRLAAEASSPQLVALAQGCLGRTLMKINPDQSEELLAAAAEAFERLGNKYEQARHLESLGRLRVDSGKAALGYEDLARAADLYRALELNLLLAKVLEDFPQLMKTSRPKGSGIKAKERVVRILVLGPLELYPATGDLPLPEGAKGQLARKVLAYLLTLDYNSRIGVDRQRILEYFWGDASSSGSMRVCLSRLKKALGHAIISYDKGLYRFRWEDERIYLDREHLDSLIQRALEMERQGRWQEAWSTYEQAESLFRGPYLEGLDDPWVKKTRIEISNIYHQFLKKLISLSEKIGKTERAEYYRNKLATA
jgi:tetratricopeptide (TPR) repeat protein